MNKQEFNEIVKDPKVLKEGDITSIEDFEGKYPYSQIIHSLSAYGSRRYKKPRANEKLTQAAVYATDRAVLKSFITLDVAPVATKKKIAKVQSPPVTSSPTRTKPVSKEPPVKRSTLPTAKPGPAKSVLKKTEPTKTEPVTASTKAKQTKAVSTAPTDHPGLLSEAEAEKLRQDVIKNLEELLEIKKMFLGEHPESGVSNKKAKPKKKPKVSSRKSPTKRSTKSEAKEVAKPKAKSLAKSKTATKATKDENKSADSKPAASIKKLKVTKSVSQEPTKKATKTTKKTTKVTKEQQNIIDKFISKKPSIRKKKTDPVEDTQDDLAKSSVAFGDHLISENLAKVMVKQGKINKAIDIYKKLIWKFPQKKAYFASQIESLKEK